jgi:hypothetical protein
MSIFRWRLSAAFIMELHSTQTEHVGDKSRSTRSPLVGALNSAFSYARDCCVTLAPAAVGPNGV